MVKVGCSGHLLVDEHLDDILDGVYSRHVDHHLRVLFVVGCVEQMDVPLHQGHDSHVAEEDENKNLQQFTLNVRLSAMTQFAIFVQLG